MYNFYRNDHCEVNNSAWASGAHEVATVNHNDFTDLLTTNLTDMITYRA